MTASRADQVEFIADLIEKATGKSFHASLWEAEELLSRGEESGDLTVIIGSRYLVQIERTE